MYNGVYGPVFKQGDLTVLPRARRKLDQPSGISGQKGLPTLNTYLT